MAKETLNVKNFGPIKDAAIDLRKVTVLIGEQASGKSVLAKLVAIFSDVTLRQILLLQKLKSFNIDSFLSENSTIKYENLDYSMHYENENLNISINEPDLKNLVEEYNKLFNQFLTSKFPGIGTIRKRNKTVGFRQNQYQLQVKLALLLNTIQDASNQAKYFPAERTIISTLSKSLFQIIEHNVKMPGFLTEFASAFEVAKNEFPHVDIPFLKIRYKFSDQADQVLLEDGTTVELANSATGFQSTVPLILVIEYYQEETQNNIFIIEEPELNLYPTTQKKLVEYLIEKCTKGDNRLIITTHSPYILTALNNCIEASNVLKANPEAKAKVDKLVPPASQIAYDDVAAYYVANGTAKSIMSEEYQMIDANALDDVSNDLARVYDSLLDLKYQAQD